MANKNKFKDLAMKSMTLSELHNNRQKLESDSLYGKELTIENFDLVDTEDMRFAVFTFVEFPDSYYNGGLILTKMIMNWIAECGSIEEALKDYHNSEPLKIKLTESKTREKNNLVTVTVI